MDSDGTSQFSWIFFGFCTCLSSILSYNLVDVTLYQSRNTDAMFWKLSCSFFLMIVIGTFQVAGWSTSFPLLFFTTVPLVLVDAICNFYLDRSNKMQNVVVVNDFVVKAIHLDVN